MSLSREEILGITDLPVREVEVPEWGGDNGATSMVYVRTLTALEAEWTLKGIDAGTNFLGRFAALMMCDASGKRLFEEADADALGDKNMASIRRIVDAAQDLNGMVEKGDDAEKN